MIIRAIAEFFSNLVPVFTLPAEILGAFTEAATLVININHYIPINTFLACLGVYFVSWLGCALLSAVLQLL